MTYLKKTVHTLFLIFVLATCCKEAIAHADTVILVSPVTGKRTPVPLLVMNNRFDTLKMKSSNVMLTNFAMWRYGRKTRYSYFEEDTTFYKMPGARNYTGHQVIADTNFKELKRVKLKSHKGIDAGKQQGLDNHEFILLSDNHYISLAYYEITPENIPDSIPHTKGMKLLTPVIQEVKKNKVVWQWVGTDYPELYSSSYYANDSTRQLLDTDFLHVNAMVVDSADNNLIISCRNADQLLKLDRKTGGIIWKLGGHGSDFKMTNYLQFMRQHHVTLPSPGKILLLDNGCKEKNRNYSRVVELAVDERNKTIKPVYVMIIPYRFIPFGGSVQRWGNSYFVCGGTEAYLFVLDAQNGKKLFSKVFGNGAYRMLKYTW